MCMLVHTRVSAREQDVMKCSDLTTDLALYADGFLTEGETLTVKGHLELCPLCRERYAEYREIGNGLRLMTRPAIPAGLKASINRAVISEVRASRRSWLP